MGPGACQDERECSRRLIVPPQLADFVNHPTQRVMVLLAQGGSGKTLTLLDLLSRVLSGQVGGGRVPLRVPLSALEDPLQSLVPAGLACASPDFLHGVDRADLGRFPLLLLLDGFDEAGVLQNLYKSNKVCLSGSPCALDDRCSLVMSSVVRARRQGGGDVPPGDH